VICLAGTGQALADTASPPPYTIASRWLVALPTADFQTTGRTIATAASLGVSATAFVLTLQMSVVYSGAFPASTTTARYGNFGLAYAGFGPGGPQTDPMTIRRAGATDGTAFERGAWGTFVSSGLPGVIDPDLGVVIQPEVQPVTYGPIRGAAMGAFSATSNNGLGEFVRSMRGWTNAPSDIDRPTGNPEPPGQSGPGSPVNGLFDLQGNLSGFDLPRADNPRAVAHLSSPNSASTYFNVYRVLLTSQTPLVYGGTGLSVEHSGWASAAWQTRFNGTAWNLMATDLNFITTSVQFGVVPAPVTGSGLVSGLLLLGARRRRPS
jgi:hypothetical protein